MRTSAELSFLQLKLFFIVEYNKHLMTQGRTQEFAKGGTVSHLPYLSSSPLPTFLHPLPH